MAVVFALGGCGMLVSGCTQSAGADWAQTSPVLKPDATNGKTAVNLGAQR